MTVAADPPLMMKRALEWKKQGMQKKKMGWKFFRGFRFGDDFPLPCVRVMN